MKIEAILAINNLRYIGKDNKLMWRCRKDLEHFKSLTMNAILIVGKNTFEGDLRGKGLPGRECIVIGTNYNSLDDALRIAKEKALAEDKKIFVIGGLMIYNQLKDIIDKWHISVIDDNQIGDKKFDIDQNIRQKADFYYFKPE